MIERSDVVMAVEYVSDLAEDVVKRNARGILRHWYAGCALAGLMACDEHEAQHCVKLAKAQSDAMLRLLDSEQQKGGES